MRDHECCVLSPQGRGIELDRIEIDLMATHLGEVRNQGIVIGNLRTECLQSLDDLRRRRFAYVVDVGFICDSDDQNARPVECEPGFVERLAVLSTT